jgi:hypothetical protein
VAQAATEADLDRAADHLARAIVILGIATVMAWLLKRSLKAGGGEAPRGELPGGAAGETGGAGVRPSGGGGPPRPGPPGGGDIPPAQPGPAAAPSGPPASSPVGRLGSPLEVQPGTNPPERNLGSPVFRACARQDARARHPSERG